MNSLIISNNNTNNNKEKRFISNIYGLNKKQKAKNYRLSRENKLIKNILFKNNSNSNSAQTNQTSQTIKLIDTFSSNISNIENTNQYVSIHTTTFSSTRIIVVKWHLMKLFYFLF